MRTDIYLNSFNFKLYKPSKIAWQLALCSL